MFFKKRWLFTLLLVLSIGAIGFQQAKAQTPTGDSGGGATADSSSVTDDNVPSSADPAAHEAPLQVETVPDVLVSSGVTSYYLSGTKTFWHTGAYCPAPPPGVTDGASNGRNPEDPEVVSRVANYGSLVRQLMLKNDVRPNGVCNPYHVHSNIVADANYTYWADDTGLVRLSTNANAGLNDTPELLDATIISAGNDGAVELAIDNNYVYAITYRATGNSDIWRWAKATNTLIPVQSNLTGISTDIRSDNSFLYWINSNGDLRRAYRLFNWVVNTIGTGISGYYPEGDMVFMGKGKQVIPYDNILSTAGAAVYTSASNIAGTQVYNITSNGVYLFVFERRPYYACVDCFLQYNQVLVRTDRTSNTNTAVLYTHLAPPIGITDSYDLTTNGLHLFWQSEDQVLRLPTYAEELPMINIKVLRMEVTQAIQDVNNNVPLITGKRTFVRVFSQAQGDYVFGVTAFLYRVDATNTNVIGGPLSPINASGTHIPVFPLPTPDIMDASFIFELPASWMDGTPLRLRAVVNPYNNPLEPNVGDNTIASKLFLPGLDLFGSPRFEPEFYSLGYSIGEQSFDPRYDKDILQTFNWIRRAYPIASAPGYEDDPTPGFRPNLHFVYLTGLGERINQSHADCQDMDEDERSTCASQFVLDRLEAWQSESHPDHLYYGLHSTGGGFGRGQGRPTVANGPAGAMCCGAAWDTDGAFTDWYTGHEMGHALGRNHPDAASGDDACGHSADDSDYPYTDAAIGPYNGNGKELGVQWGFDMGAGVAAYNSPRRILQSSVWRDVMSYCDFQWVSDYTYMGLYNGMIDLESGLNNTYTRIPQGADMLSVYGFLLPNKHMAQIHYLSHSNSVVAVPQRTAGTYSIRLLDASNAVLADYPFTPDAAEEGQTFQSFGEIVPFVAGTVKIQIVETTANEVWREETVSANAPVVSNVALQAASNPVTGLATLSWTAVDADNDSLIFDIYYSQDNGTSYEPVVFGVVDSSYALDTDKLGGSSTAVFKVVANDGVNTGFAASAPLNIAIKAPLPQIINPADGAQVDWGQLVTLEGDAFDYQEGGLPTQFVWSNQYGVLGRASSISIEDLPVGENTITLEVTNGEGVSASTTITVIVKDDLEFEPALLEVGPTETGWQVTASETAVQTATLTIANAGLDSMTWTATSDASWLTLDHASGSTQDSLLLMGDPTAVLPGTAAIAHVTITGTDNVGGDPQVIVIPVTLSVDTDWTNHQLYFRQIYIPFAFRP